MFAECEGVRGDVFAFSRRRSRIALHCAITIIVEILVELPVQILVELLVEILVQIVAQVKIKKPDRRGFSKLSGASGKTASFLSSR